MSHTQQQVPKWSKNAWKSGTKCHMPSQHHFAHFKFITLQWLWQVILSFFHIRIARIMFDQGILRIFHVFVWLRAVVRAYFGGVSVGKCTNVVVFPIQSNLQWTAAAAIMFALHMLLNIHHICRIVTTGPLSYISTHPSVYPSAYIKLICLSMVNPPTPFCFVCFPPDLVHFNKIWDPPPSFWDKIQTYKHV